VLYRKRDPDVGAIGVPNFHTVPISDCIKIRGQFFFPPQNIPPGYQKIGKGAVVHTLGFTSWLFYLGAGVLLNRVRICIEEGHIKPKRC
jgi:hypothetical protein